jgi:formylglycine-generating enzyme required for sulfatase activity
VSRIFLSHSSVDNAYAVALRDWLVGEGWNDLFLDLDSERGIAAGERWEQALHAAANRCEAVLFLISKAWLASPWCKNELNLARRLNKRLFGVLIEEVSLSEIPSDVIKVWQVVRLAAGTDHKQFEVVLPITGGKTTVTFSLEGLARLKAGLRRAGLHASYFNWPPPNDPNRPPYRGLRPLEADDAGIFFGREAPVIEVIDRLRGLRETAPPRLLVILGASGSGKSSFLRAGLFPRLARDERSFLPLPIIRPERAALYGDAGLLRALEGGFEATRMPKSRAELRAAIQAGADKLKPLLQAVAEKATPTALGDTALLSEASLRPPTIVLSIDQGEELFLAEAGDEAHLLLVLLRDLLSSEPPAVIALLTMRSDNYEQLQLAKDLAGLRQDTFSLAPMPKGAFVEVIKGPTRRLDGTERAIKIDDNLVQELLTDIEAGGAKDALPLLAFTLERLYSEFQAARQLKREHYEQLGRIGGSIDAAVERAFKTADGDPRIPRDRHARLALLRRGFIPWLAGIDPETKAPRRRIARLSEIPDEARPLVDQLVEQRLLSTDIDKATGETTIEPTHEALLRQWGLLQGWLEEDTGLLTVLEGAKRASRDWAANDKAVAWLVHGGERLRSVEALVTRTDLSAHLEATDREYLAACRAVEQLTAEKERAGMRVRRRLQTAMMASLVGMVLGLIAFINKDQLVAFVHWNTTVRMYIARNITPFLLSAEAELALKSQALFRECAKACPEMVVVPAGKFVMGSPEGQGEPDEHPQRHVTFARPFAVSKFEVTFDDWEECVALGGCPAVSDSGWGKGRRPVVSVSWTEAKQYVAWLSTLTGRDYRLLTEAEWEYAARAGTTTAYNFGDDQAKLCAHANLADRSLKKAAAELCDDGQVVTAPVGSYLPNAFGLYDTLGNAAEWVEDAYQDSHIDALADGSARKGNDASPRVLRGGSWSDGPEDLRSAFRGRAQPADRLNYFGFRVARTLLHPPR